MTEYDTLNTLDINTTQPIITAHSMNTDFGHNIDLIGFINNLLLL